MSRKIPKNILLKYFKHFRTYIVFLGGPFKMSERNNKNRFYQLRCELYNKETKRDYPIKKLSEEIGIAAPKISELELDVRNATLNELIAYNKRFNVPIDYLLGITNSRTYESTGSSFTIGLSDKSIQVLKEWNELKKSPFNGINGYGGTDIDALNLLLEDYYNLSMKAKSQDALADWSIFHHIYNYVFSEHLKKQPYNTVVYTHDTNVSDKLKKGDVIISDGFERTINKIETYNGCGFESSSDNFSIYNDTNQDETYTISFQKVMDSYTKDNIIKILERIKKRVKGGK